MHRMANGVGYSLQNATATNSSSSSSLTPGWDARSNFATVVFAIATAGAPFLKSADGTRQWLRSRLRSATDATPNMDASRCFVMRICDDTQHSTESSAAVLAKPNQTLSWTISPAVVTALNETCIDEGYALLLAWTPLDAAAMIMAVCSTRRGSGVIAGAHVRNGGSGAAAASRRAAGGDVAVAAVHQTLSAALHPLRALTKPDVVRLLSSLASPATIFSASKDALGSVVGIGEKKATAAHRVFNAPFPSSRKRLPSSSQPGTPAVGTATPFRKTERSQPTTVVGRDSSVAPAAAARQHDQSAMSVMRAALRRRLETNDDGEEDG